ncbi:sporulation protein YpjB [Paenibacillus harenae]|uniref:sporulation protein YpjB n=1 Tax=Paenibacillus harenae TaxID=306543 RepID=UPI000419562D|nr:sporulation protein YpjB [Paenibacillus harenae]
MKVRIIIPFVICIVMTIGGAGAVWGSSSSLDRLTSIFSPQSQMQLSRMDEIANSLYQAAYTNNRQAGFQYVQQLQRMIGGELKYAAGNRDGWESMKQDADAIKLKLTSRGAHSVWLQEAARIRLAADALSRSDHALWLQYESVMLDDLTRLEKAWKRQTDDAAEAARASMNSLQEHAVRIEPAISLLYGSMRYTELSERIRYTNQLLDSAKSSSGNEAMVEQSLKALKFSIYRIFEQSGAEASLPAVAPPAAAHPLGWTLFLGAIISAVLTYSGWRKYKMNPFDSKPLS